MTRRPAALAAALVTALLLAGCGGSDPVHGKVTEKEYDRARTTWSTETKTKRVCTTSRRRSGKRTTTSRTCHNVSTGTKRVAHRHPECWELDLDTGRDICVSEHTWRTTDVGDHY